MDDGVDEREVGERLGEVPEMAARVRVELLAVQSERAGVGQELLAEAARSLVARGCRVMLSNSDTPFIRSIYKGFRVERVKCARAINSNASKRGEVDELVITGGY